MYVFIYQEILLKHMWIHICKQNQTSRKSPLCQLPFRTEGFQIVTLSDLVLYLMIIQFDTKLQSQGIDINDSKLTEITRYDQLTENSTEFGESAPCEVKNSGGNFKQIAGHVRHQSIRLEICDNTNSPSWTVPFLTCKVFIDCALIRLLIHL